MEIDMTVVEKLMDKSALFDFKNKILCIFFSKMVLLMRLLILQRLVKYTTG